MLLTPTLRRAAIATALAFPCSFPRTLDAQGQGQSTTPRAVATREANRIDVEGRTADARAIFQRLIDSADTPAARAQSQRAMAMSYAFDGDCANTVKYEEMVIAYW